MPSIKLGQSGVQLPYMPTSLFRIKTSVWITLSRWGLTHLQGSQVWPDLGVTVWVCGNAWPCLLLSPVSHACSGSRKNTPTHWWVWRCAWWFSMLIFIGPIRSELKAHCTEQHQGVEKGQRRIWTRFVALHGKVPPLCAYTDTVSQGVTVTWQGPFWLSLDSRIRFSQEAMRWCWDTFWMWFCIFRDSSFNPDPLVLSVYAHFVVLVLV